MTYYIICIVRFTDSELFNVPIKALLTVTGVYCYYKRSTLDVIYLGLFLVIVFPYSYHYTISDTDLRVGLIQVIE